MSNKPTGKNPVPLRNRSALRVGTARIRKSEKLTAEEKQKLVSWLKKQDTLIDAADLLQVHRGTLDRIRKVGSGNPETIAKIRAAIGVPCAN
jgi:hypothetical protein